MVIQQKTCKNCATSTMIEITGDILCPKKGVVEMGYVCFKHKFAEGKRQSLKCVSCSNFIAETKTANSNIGVCKLFTVRKYNGLEKNVCSRFTRADT